VTTDAHWQFEGIPNAAGYYPAIVRDDSALYATGLFFDGVAWRRHPDLVPKVPKEGDYSQPPRDKLDTDVIAADQVAAFLPLICADKVSARETAEERYPRFLQNAPANDD
jgi:hypothetical protein